MSNDSHKMSFSSLILGLSSAALSYLGVGDEDDSDQEIHLELASQNIDILALLEEKTKNNLTDDETKLLANVLADLRHKYLEACRKTAIT